MPDDAPHYEEFDPPATLRDFVHCLWHFRADRDETPQPIVPDGRPELIVHLGVPYREAPGMQRQDPILFAGQLTRPLNLVADGAVDVWGVRFRPDGASGFLGVPVSEATDRRVALSAFHGEAVERLQAAMTQAKEPAAAQNALISYLDERLDGRVDAAVRAAVSSIMAGRDWQAPSDVSYRQFQRRFKAAVGVSSRMLQSIRRFRSLFDRMEADEDRSWSRKALAAGYFDQPQMARDFRRFLGCTARDWLAQPEGLARHVGESAD